MADSDFKSQVLTAIDIVELISGSVSLKRRGKNYVGLCPFHNEKTPSFNVDPTKGYFKCFGCKASGNAIDFVMKRDRLDFLEAMKQLGERAGLEMPKFGLSKHKTSEKQALLDAHAKAADFYHRNLLHPQLGKPARDYLTSRGFTDETIKTFKVGYAPPGWDNLLRCREVQGIPPGLLAVGGLLKTRNEGGGHYDTFRNRLMFPIRDEQGRTIAFGGRVMPGSEDPAKYLNSPETPLFSKSRAVFALDQARDKIVLTRTVAITEGYTDSVMAHQFGASNTVSVLGTALTEQHLTILRRFADRVVLLFDADSAGETAVNRAVELFLTQPLDIAIATIPEDLDPDEYLLKHGVAAYDLLLKDAADALEFKWKLLQREFDAAGGSLTGQQKAVETYLNLLSGARGSGPVDDLRWGSALRRVERLTGIPMEQLSKRFASKPAPRPQFHGGNRPTQAQAPQHEEVPSMPDGVEGGGGGSQTGQSEASNRAERWILGILLAEPSRWLHVQKDVSPELFRDRTRRRLAEFYWDRQRNEGEPTFAELLGELPDEELKQTATNLLEEAENLGEIETTLGGALSYFASLQEREAESKLGRALDRKEEDEKQAELFKAFVQRVQQRHTPKRDS